MSSLLHFSDNLTFLLFRGSHITAVCFFVLFFFAVFCFAALNFKLKLLMTAGKVWYLHVPFVFIQT